MTGRHTPADLRQLGSRTAIVVATALALLAGVAVVVLAAEVLLLVFAGLLFAVLLSSIADALVRISGMRRAIALGLTVLALLAAAGVTAWALWPSVSEQANQLSSRGAASANDRAQLHDIHRTLRVRCF